MEPHELARQIEQIERWRDSLPTDLDPRAVPHDEALETLGVTLEELRVAGEELHRMGDRLAGAQQAIEAGQRRYRELFELAPVAFVITDPLGSVVEANRAATELLHIRARHLARKPLVYFLPEEARAAFRAELMRLIEGAGRLANLETRIRPRGLPPVPVALAASVVYGPGGVPVAIHWAIHDLSGRVGAEALIRNLNAELEQRVADRTAQLRERIRDQEELLIAAHAADAQGLALRDLVHGLDAVVWRADAASGRYTFVSRHAEELLGYPASHWLDDPGFWAGLVHPEDRAWAVKNRARALAEGRDHEAEYRMMAASGRTVWFRESARFRRDDAGRPVELRGLMVNISHRKKVERQLYAAKQELSSELADLRFLHDLYDRLSPAAELGPLVREVLESVAAVVGGQKGALYLREPEGDAWSLAAGLELPDAFAALVSRVPAGSPWRGRVLAVDEPILVADLHAVPGHTGYLPVLQAGGIRAVFSVPILARGEELLGALAILFDEPHRPPEPQVRLVERYVRKAAEYVALALRRRAEGNTDSPLLHSY